MAVRAKQYAMELERELGKGKSLARAQKVSAMRSKAGSKADKFDRPSLMDKVILGILRKTKRKSKPKFANRTQAITSRLKKAGLSESDILKLKGKKK